MAGKTLLIVEDNSFQREGLAVILRQEGYAVVTAAEGNEALTYLRDHPAPDLVLLDMMIPASGCDGWRFMELHGQTPALAAIPVIITTGLGIGNREWARSLGAVGFLKKPFDVAPLLEEIQRCC